MDTEHSSLYPDFLKKLLVVFLFFPFLSFLGFQYYWVQVVLCEVPEVLCFLFERNEGFIGFLDFCVCLFLLISFSYLDKCNSTIHNCSIVDIVDTLFSR